MIKRCACTCHMTNEPNCTCYSCECAFRIIAKRFLRKQLTLDSFNLDGTNTAIKKNMVWGKIDGHISLTNNKND